MARKSTKVNANNTVDTQAGIFDFQPVIMKVRLTLLEDMLGASPNDKEIYSTFVASKGPNAMTKEEEVAAIGVEEYEEKQMTVFCRNEDGNPIIFNYVIKGFFKNACGALRYINGSLSKGITSYKKKIDGLIFIDERQIPINYEGKIGICQRPLRAQTAQGDRVALASSESIPAGSTLECTIRIMDPTLVPVVTEWLNYGRYNGLGQWHNSGKGAFTWEEITE